LRHLDSGRRSWSAIAAFRHFDSGRWLERHRRYTVPHGNGDIRCAGCRQ
jgi:hypothetical protein